ncbi:MAG: hypothetical protein E7575_07420 [Ruminococcaceae bacterium]|nr:hypothetical protein [Oscillospiraceae bacterium]
MFAVKPLQDKELQSELCTLLNTPYLANCFAHFAVDLNEDGTKIEAIIGICQFSLGETAEIFTLVPFPGKENDEAMIIMERAVMNFMWRSGSKSFVMKESAGPEELLKRSGLPKKDGTYFVDLDLFFKSPCSFNKNSI